MTAAIDKKYEEMILGQIPLGAPPPPLPGSTTVLRQLCAAALSSGAAPAGLAAGAPANPVNGLKR